MLPISNSIAFYAGFAFVGYLFWRTCKNLHYAFFGPLARYPGPHLWAFTDLAYWYYALRGELNAKIKHLHDQYGEVVRIAPTRISFTSSDAWKDVYINGHNNEHKIFQKDPVFYAVFRESKVPRGINNAEGAYHARLRRQLSYAFSDRALKEQEPLITSHFDMLIKRLRGIASINEKTDMTQWYNFLTFDATALTPKRVKLARAAHNVFVDEKVQARLEKVGAEGVQKRDFISYLLRQKTDQEALTQQEITINASILVIAGSETTATAMTGVTYWLLRSPSTLKKVTLDVREAFDTEAEINFSNTTDSRVPYLGACIEEGLRLYPPSPAGLPRVVDSDSLIAGHPIPKDTIVSIHQYSTYRSEDNFYRANEFWPERWLPDMPEFATDKKNALNPFLLGPRNCIGQLLAYSEIRVVLARILWNFDMSLCEESEKWHEQKSFNLWVKKPLHRLCQFKDKAIFNKQLIEIGGHENK
ncbi:MAG: hypothetical protein Q9195_006798 [Heterodermia aff. obscurata]